MFYFHGYCVFIAATLYYQVDKIFGFDPAGAGYDYHTSKYRLDKADATVVHVMHTSTPFLGMEDPIGDVDFYPNGLWNNQPLTCPNADKIKCGCPNTFAMTPWFYNGELQGNYRNTKTSLHLLNWEIRVVQIS